MRFGRLVRSYREDTGLSLRDLAVRVWDDEGRKASLSRLENGRVGRPAAKTVQLIALALDIPQEEIDRLHEPALEPVVDLSAQLDYLSRSSRDQLEALALRFEIERVFERPSSELRELLERKAEEFRAYRRQFQLLDDRQEEIVAARTAANAAAERMDFEESESQLRVADRLQTLLAVETKEVRATQALMQGRVEEAYTIFVSAAEALREIDLLEMALRRDRYCRQLYSHGVRYGQEGLSFALELQRPAVEALQDTDWREDWAKVLSNQAMVMATMAAHGDDESAELLDGAVQAFREALSYYSKEETPRKWALTQQNLAGALHQLAVMTEDRARKTELFEQSISTLRLSLGIRRKEVVPDEWAMTMHNLAISLRELGKGSKDEIGQRYVREAVEAGEQALTVRTQAEHPLDWAVTKEQLAWAEYALALHPTINDSELHIRAACTHVEELLVGCDRGKFPLLFERATELRQELEEAASPPKVET
ncbi:helix-turn-helix domain-containing protein [Histidinibacterium aquaticum]|nr:helix-turn-helix transcriptional regulator [Histidinibacterium aquaticum]